MGLQTVVHQTVQGDFCNPGICFTYAFLFCYTFKDGGFGSPDSLPISCHSAAPLLVFI